MTLHKKIPGLRFNVSRALFVLLVIFYALYVATTLRFPRKGWARPNQTRHVDSWVFSWGNLLQLWLEVAHISASHGHAIVEFFDIRSAQAGSGETEFSWVSSLGSSAAGGCYGCCGVCRQSHGHGDLFSMWTTSEHLTCADAVGSCVGKRDTMVSCWGLKLLISWLLETRNCDNRAMPPALPVFFGDTAAQLQKTPGNVFAVLLAFWYPSFCFCNRHTHIIELVFCRIIELGMLESLCLGCPNRLAAGYNCSYKPGEWNCYCWITLQTQKP